MEAGASGLISPSKQSLTAWLSAPIGPGMKIYWDPKAEGILDHPSEA